MRKFSVRPTLTVRGRTFKGLRGWSGKPAHPPLTDFPIAAYLFAAAFDIIASLGRHESWARDFFRAGTYVFIAGAAVSVLAALTGFWDWLRSTEAGTQARRTANAHAVTMLTVTVLALVDIALRLNVYNTRTHPTIAILALDRRRRARVARRDVRRNARVRLRLQRGDRVRQSGVAQVRDRRAPGRALRVRHGRACSANGAGAAVTDIPSCDVENAPRAPTPDRTLAATSRGDHHAEALRLHRPDRRRVLRGTERRVRLAQRRRRVQRVRDRADRRGRPARVRPAHVRGHGRTGPRPTRYATTWSSPNA